MASVLPRPNHEVISHHPSLAVGATVTASSVRSHPPEPSPDEHRGSFIPSPSLPGSCLTHAGLCFPNSDSVRAFI